jgi:S-(hydroxymethyl)glutathione dehydrogenase/alcohol dehydrogenase
MKAAVLQATGTPLEILDVKTDSPGPDEVLVRTAAAGVCHSDLHFVEGLYPHPLPAVLGHESAGIIEAVGSHVQDLAPGDHVITCLSVFCGHCEYCLSGRPSLCASNEMTRAPAAPSRLSLDGSPIWQFMNLSSFAEELLVHRHAVVKIPADIPLDRAALIGCGVTTGLGAVFRTARVEAGTTVAVVGCGGVGLNCVQGAAIAGAARIIAVDRVASKLELARQFGATDVVDASAHDAVAAVLELSDGGVHYSFEAIGLAATVQQAFAMLRRGGTATVIGMVPFGLNVELPAFEFLREKRIQGSTMGSNRFRIDMPRYLELYRQGRLKLDELVSARRPLAEVNEAFADMKGGTVARTVLVFDGVS